MFKKSIAFIINPIRGTFRKGEILPAEDKCHNNVAYRYQKKNPKNMFLFQSLGVTWVENNINLEALTNKL